MLSEDMVSVVEVLVAVVRLTAYLIMKFRDFVLLPPPLLLPCCSLPSMDKALPPRFLLKIRIHSPTL